MKADPKQEVHYRLPVWVNPTTEPLRKEECLCLNCGRLKPGSLQNCATAQQLYQLCVENDVALCLTRCPMWRPLEAQPQE